MMIEKSGSIRLKDIPIPSGATPEQRERLRLCISELRLGGMTREDLLALCAECYGGEEQ